MAWNVELEGWETQAEAEAARDAANAADPNAEALVLKLVEGCWLELDDEGDAEAFEVSDGSGAFVLFPDSEADVDPADLDATDIAHPTGFVWVFCR